jgi:hypothetical protein
MQQCLLDTLHGVAAGMEYRLNDSAVDEYECVSQLACELKGDDCSNQCYETIAIIFLTNSINFSLVSNQVFA